MGDASSLKWAMSLLSEPWTTTRTSRSSLVDEQIGNRCWCAGSSVFFTDIGCGDGFGGLSCAVNVADRDAVVAGWGGLLIFDMLSHPLNIISHMVSARTQSSCSFKSFSSLRSAWRLSGNRGLGRNKARSTPRPRRRRLGYTVPVDAVIAASTSMMMGRSLESVRNAVGC